jgi:hypothetical protein
MSFGGIRSLNAIALILWGTWMIFWPCWTIFHRLSEQVDGTIVSARSTSGPRFATWYAIRQGDGQTKQYVAGATDDSLPRRMPVGTVIAKKKYEACYMRDGVTVCDFPWSFDSIVIAIGIASLVLGVVAKWKQARPTA